MVTNRLLKNNYAIILLTKISVVNEEIVGVCKWWRQTESNRRHKDFQSFALPTELWSHAL